MRTLFAKAKRFGDAAAKPRQGLPSAKVSKQANNFGHATSHGYVRNILYGCRGDSRITRFGFHKDVRLPLYGRGRLPFGEGEMSAKPTEGYGLRERCSSR